MRTKAAQTVMLLRFESLPAAKKGCSRGMACAGIKTAGIRGDDIYRLLMTMHIHTYFHEMKWIRSPIS
jgi:hypothetical protein